MLTFHVGEMVRAPALGVRDGLWIIERFESIPTATYPVAVIKCAQGDNVPNLYKNGTRCALSHLKRMSPLEHLARQAE